MAYLLLLRVVVQSVLLPSRLQELQCLKDQATIVVRLLICSNRIRIGNATTASIGLQSMNVNSLNAKTVGPTLYEYKKDNKRL
jgi:hypothetical protein